MTEKLLPCPFCGGEVVWREFDERHPYEPYGLIADHKPDCFLSLHTNMDEIKQRWNTRAAMQADAAPDAWLYRAGPYLRKYGPDLPPVIKLAVSRWPIETQANWTETPLYAHPPVDDRVSTTKPVDDRETGNTSDKTDTAPVVKSDTAPVSDKLRPAVEVWREAWRSVALLSSEHEDVRLNEAVAELHRVIEADREAVRAEQAAEIAALKSAWEAQHKEKVAERAEAKLWFEQAQEAKTELAKWKALAETLAGALDKLHEAYCADDYGTSEGRAFGRTALIETREALREYKESRDAV